MKINLNKMYIYTLFSMYNINCDTDKTVHLNEQEQISDEKKTKKIFTPRNIGIVVVVVVVLSAISAFIYRKDIKNKFFKGTEQS
jgi:hypothetical protein